MTTKNALAEHLTTWRWWYAIPSLFVVVLASMVMLLGGEPGEDMTRQAVLVVAQFVALAVFSLGAIALLARRWPTRRDLGLRRGITARQLVVVAVVFVVSHALFVLFSMADVKDPDRARTLFEQSGLDGPLLPAALMLLASTVLAPVCEELLYRGAMLRPIHDHIARRGSARLAAVVAIAVSTILFAMPHLGEGATLGLTASYLVTGIAMGLVYVLTGSMTAVMVAHSLQSCVAFVQILALGAGDHAVSPLLWVIALGCPLWVYLVARGLHAVFPRGRQEA